MFCNLRLAPRSWLSLALLCLLFSLGCGAFLGTSAGLAVLALGDSFPAIFGITPLPDPSLVPSTSTFAVLILDPARWGVNLPLLVGVLVGFATTLAVTCGILGLYLSALFSWAVCRVLSYLCRYCERSAVAM